VRCIADANVLLPLLTEGHAHGRPADEWWQGCEDGDVGVCWPVRMALLRLLTNARVMGSGVQSPAQAWDAVRQLIDDPRVSMIDQLPAGHLKLWRENVLRREPTPNLWADAWLAAAAQISACDMVTFDRGFRSFPKLSLRLLVPA
jgi:toxin-antitoxin system PIN domain toxin